LKKKNHLGRQAVFYYLSHHCVWNWQIGATCSCRRLCSLRRCRGQILREKVEGGGGGGAGDSSPLGLPNGMDKGGDPLYSSHTSTFFQITHIHNIYIYRPIIPARFRFSELCEMANTNRQYRTIMWSPRTGSIGGRRPLTAPSYPTGEGST